MQALTDNIVWPVRTNNYLVSRDLPWGFSLRAFVICVAFGHLGRSKCWIYKLLGIFFILPCEVLDSVFICDHVFPLLYTHSTIGKQFWVVKWRQGSHMKMAFGRETSRRFLKQSFLFLFSSLCQRWKLMHQTLSVYTAQRLTSYNYSQCVRVCHNANIQFRLVIRNVSYVWETDSVHGLAVWALGFFDIITLKILIVLSSVSVLLNP